MGDYHIPVMLEESLAGLAIVPTDSYVDVTFGGGGHSLAILEKLKGGKLIALDQDEEAQREAGKINHRSFTFCHANFRHLKAYLKLNGVETVKGILADLGISSHQIDEASRGFSTRFEGPLDMRMSKNLKTTAADVVNHYSEADLHKILGMYGEVRNAKTAASRIVQERIKMKIKTTLDLKTALAPLAPRGKEHKYFAQVFQALRIEVNEEMKALEEFLLQCAEVIEKDGRLVIITYHSLEDRMVKNFFSQGKTHGMATKDMYGSVEKPFEVVNRKPITPSEEELEKNKRARSAKLRIGRKLN